MINLLPPARKESILYARRNASLVSWVLGVGIAGLGILAITGGSLFYLRQDSSTIRSSIEATQSDLAAQDEEAVLQRAEEMSGNLKLAVDVLSNEVLFSKLLQQIGLVMPRGTVLQSLSLTSDIASSGISLEISATDYQAGSQAHVNLNDPENGIFERADLENITCSNEDSAYPCLVSIRALFVKDNPFLLISKGGNK